ncbi:MAG: dynamin family protein, partial [Desulfobacterota bacterium]|nr:dynamin family protein [Thermodesulfobacteriota bacterium]
RHLQAARELIAESRYIDIAILGQFKAGKTSFINSLIGNIVLPVGVIPVTTVITRITRVQYGETQRAVVTFLDGTHKDIPIDKVEEYISEAHNPANCKNVAVVDLELPVFEHYQGLRFVDTPGLGSAYKYNTATSEDWLPRVGAAIVAISADRPLSESDLSLLRELMAYTPDIVLLLTKADLLLPSQQDEVVQFLKETVKQELNAEFPIFLYSTRVDTSRYRARLDDELFCPLVKNRDSELHKISIHKINSLANACIEYLEIALKASQQADQDRERIKQLIFDERVNYELIRSELSLIAREHMIKTRDHIIAHLHTKHSRELTRRIMAALREAMKTWQGNLWKFTRQYERWIAETMAAELQALSQAEHQHFFETLYKARAGIARAVGLFKNMLDQNIERVLGTKLGEAQWDISVEEPPHPDIAFAHSFDFHLDLLWFVIPMCIFRRAFERHFLHQIPWAVEVNISRLAHQWEVAVNRAIDETKNKALRYVENELSTIEALLSQTQGQTDEIAAAIKRLRELQT